MFSGHRIRKDPDQSARPHYLIRAFAVCQFILQYSVTMDGKGPDQTVQLPRSASHIITNINERKWIPSEKGSALKGRNLLPLGANSFF